MKTISKCRHYALLAMILAFVAAMTMSITACSADDDDPGPDNYIILPQTPK
jgi:hypothetical protein